MPYTVLRVTRADETRVEVVAEFADKEDAKRFTADAQINDPDNAYEYLLETPPSQQNGSNP